MAAISQYIKSTGGSRMERADCRVCAEGIESQEGVRNVTRGTVLHTSPEWALSTWEKARGFMFTRPKNRAIIFLFLPAKRVTLHMWFVFGAIDVLALDGEGTVVACKRHFRPWAFWSTNSKVSAIVELPDGSIARSGTVLGDTVVLPRVTISKRVRQS